MLALSRNDHPIILRHLLAFGVLLEVLLFGFAWVHHESFEEVFRHAARWSGRLSLVVYLLAFHVFATSFRRKAMGLAQRMIILFCVLHFIHLGFVGLNIRLNHIPLVPYKLAGGALAYAMILVYPFLVDRVKEKVATHLIYFYYVGTVMAITIVARIRGDFEGAQPSLFHYFGLGAIITAFIGHGRMVLRRNRIQDGSHTKKGLSH